MTFEKVSVASEKVSDAIKMMAVANKKMLLYDETTADTAADVCDNKKTSDVIEEMMAEVYAMCNGKRQTPASERNLFNPVCILKVVLSDKLKMDFKDWGH